MIKILIVVPYEELREEVGRYLAAADLRDFHVEVEHLVGTEGAPIRDCDADIVVARGITGRAIARGHPGTHLVEISVSGTDLISALWRAKLHLEAREVGVVATDPNICDPGQLKDLTGLPVRLRVAESEAEVYAAIEELRALGVDTFIGGLTLCRRCEDRGLRHVHIKSGSEAVLRALNEAMAAARSLSRERARRNLMGAVLNNAEDALFAVSLDGIVMAANAQASELFLGSREPELEGRALTDFLPAEEAESILACREGGESLMRVKDTLVLLRTRAISVGQDNPGLLVTCRNVEALRETEQKIRRELGKKGLVAHYRFGDILHRSAVMRSMVAKAFKYSQTDSTILVVGETGTGKELFAQSIHNASRRNSGPFVAVNCAALPEQLLESELFGYVEGAFSGAVKGGRMGLFELSHKGTIFLDEIGEMPLALQAKLLRVLQEKEVRRIGADSVLPIDVRVISATNIDILRRVRSGEFREDLYYRLNLLTIRVPPLRERPEDIELVFSHFLERFALASGKRTPRVDGEVENALSAYSWPGNIRELKNFCERLVVLNESGEVDRRALEEAGFLEEPDGGSREAWRPDLEAHNAEACGAGPRARSLAERLKESGLDQEAFAAGLGISRTTLWRRLREEAARLEGKGPPLRDRRP